MALETCLVPLLWKYPNTRCLVFRNSHLVTESISKYREIQWYYTLRLMCTHIMKTVKKRYDSYLTRRLCTCNYSDALSFVYIQVFCMYAVHFSFYILMSVSLCVWCLCPCVIYGTYGMVVNDHLSLNITLGMLHVVPNSWFA